MPVITIQFPANISVTNLNGQNGFSIIGFPSNSGGAVVGKAGDVNADGIADLVIGTPNADSFSGAAYVIFGESGLGSSGSISVSSLTGINGFAVTGFSGSNDVVGCSVSGAGDVNADGINDLIIGAQGYIGDGGAFVIFGKSGLGSSGSIDISSLNGSNGFIFRGMYPGTGQAVSAVGDVNGDGIADLLIGAHYLPNACGLPPCLDNSYVIFGQSGLGNTGSISVSDLNGANGFAIVGFPVGGNAGSSVSGVGDVNADGINDFMIGAYGAYGYAGVGYVIFGKSSGLGSSGRFNVTDLNGLNGFTITGFPAGSYGGASVSGVGDVNGDGIVDLAVGAAAAPPAGATYVIFGKSGLGSSGSFNVSQLTGSNGFAITFTSSISGGSPVNEAGDINGDGISDIVIGVSYLIGEGSVVIFGKTGLGSSGMISISTSSLTGNNGFAIAFPSNAATIFSAGVGDINADGIADLASGAYLSTVTPGINPGITYVTFGEPVSSIFLSENHLTINEDQTFRLSSQYLNATNPKIPSKDSTLQFTLNAIKHSRFYSSTNSSLSLQSFTQQQVRSGQIYFAHDGSSWAPAYNVSVKYPGLFSVSPSLAAAITFQQSFVLVNNNLTINQGQTVVITVTDLSASDLDNNANNPNLVFSVSNVQHGYFALTSSPTSPITAFTQAQVQNGKVQFVHDASINPPSYNVAVVNGASRLTAQAAIISFDAIPLLTVNSIVINQGQTVVLSSNNLSATNPYNSAASLSFMASNVKHGYFALTSAPMTSITSFTQAQVQSGAVQFVHDGSTNAPSYSVTVSDGRTTSTAQAGTVSFDAIPTFTANSLTINQGQTVVLSSNNLDASDSYAVSSFTYTVSNIQHGYFSLTSAPTAAISSFTQAQIQSSSVQFVHDGSIYTPSYNVTATDGRVTSSTQAAIISFDATPVLTANTLTVNQGQTIVLSATNLNAINPYNSKASLSFTVSQVQYGHFELVNNPGVAVTSFTQAQISGSQVQFVCDGTANSPTYSVSANDGRLSSQPQASAISFDVPPVIEKNSIAVTQGQKIILTSNNLSATDPYDTPAEITFTVSNVQNGQFELVTNPGAAITSFTQAQINSGQIQFVQDGSSAAPGYVLSVSDGRMTGVAGIGASTVGLVNFTPTAQPVSGADNGINVRNAIIGGSVSGGLSLLFLIAKLYITRKATQSLQKAIEGGTTDVEKQQATHYREVVRPIANKVFEKINTTGFLGYRSEEDAKGYIEAIQRIIANLESLGINMNFKSLSASQRDLIINEIAKQTKHVVGKKYRCCTSDYVCRFFKAEVTPQELDRKASEIAGEAHKALNASVTVRPLSSPVADDARVATLELSEMKPMQIPAAG